MELNNNCSLFFLLRQSSIVDLDVRSLFNINNCFREICNFKAPFVKMDDPTTPKTSRAKRRCPIEDDQEVDWNNDTSEDGNQSPSSYIPWDFGKPVIDESRMDDVREVRRRLQLVRQARKIAKKRNFGSFLTTRSPSVSPVISKRHEKDKRVIDHRKLIECQESLRLSCENLDKAIKAAKAKSLETSHSPRPNKVNDTSEPVDNDPILWDDSFDPTVVDAVAEVEKNYYSSQTTTSSQTKSSDQKSTCDAVQSFMDDDDDDIFLAESLNQY